MDACIYIYCVVVGGRLSHTRHGQSPSWIGKRLVQAIECLPRRVSFSFTLFFIFSSISSFYFNRMRFLALSYRYFYCLLSLYIYPFKICSTSLRFFFFFPPFVWESTGIEMPRLSRWEFSQSIEVNRIYSRRFYFAMWL